MRPNRGKMTNMNGMFIIPSKTNNGFYAAIQIPQNNLTNIFLYLRNDYTIGCSMAINCDGEKLSTGYFETLDDLKRAICVLFGDFIDKMDFSELESL